MGRYHGREKLATPHTVIVGHIPSMEDISSIFALFSYVEEDL